MVEDHIPPPETILLVEDEILIRMDMAEFLRQSGYRVSEAGNASEAIDALNMKLAIDLVVTDVVMPGEMDGYAFARWVQDHRPDVQVVFQSADAPELLPDELKDFGPILQKPYTCRDLLDRVKLALSKRPSPPVNTESKTA